jgi:putative ABC transport system ATP-binding protein
MDFSNNAPIIQIKSLDKTYPSGKQTLHILQGLDLEIQAGSSTAITGASGSGKTTLLHLIAGLHIPNKGQITCCGQQIETMDENKRSDFRAQNIGLIFQSFELLTGLSVLDNLSLPLQMLNRDNPEKKAKYWINQLGLSPRLQHLPSELSGGEQQRVAIARALALEPQIILADEPTGDLDEKNSLHVAKLLLDICKAEQTTLLIATHEADLAENCKHHYAMENGQLIQKR